MNKYEEQSKAAQEKNRRLMNCERKKAFTSYKEASERKGQSVYKCEYCGYFHRTTALEQRIGILNKKLYTKKKSSKKRKKIKNGKT